MTELQRQGRLVCVGVGLDVLDQGGDVVRQRDLIANGPAGAPTVPWILQPSGELAKAMNFLAASSLAPSVVLGMYRAFGIQTVTGCRRRPARATGRIRRH